MTRTPTTAHEPRRRVVGRRDSTSATFRDTLVLSCGHIIYVKRFSARYRRGVATVGCPACAVGLPVTDEDRATAAEVAARS